MLKTKRTYNLWRRTIETVQTLVAEHHLIVLYEFVRKCPSHRARGGLERETGFEPATFCLGSRHSAS